MLPSCIKLARKFYYPNEKEKKSQEAILSQKLEGKKLVKLCLLCFFFLSMLKAEKSLLQIKELLYNWGEWQLCGYFKNAAFWQVGRC